MYSLNVQLTVNLLIKAFRFVYMIDITVLYGNVFHIFDIEFDLNHLV